MNRFIRVDDDDNEPKLVMISDGRAIHTGNGRTYRVEEEPMNQGFGGGVVLGIILAGIGFLLFSSSQPPAPLPPGTPSQSFVIPPGEQAR